MPNTNEEKNIQIIEIYTKHIEVSSKILQSIVNLTVNLKKYDENFKSIDSHFLRLIEELDFLKLHVERSLKNHDAITASRYERLTMNNNEVKDDFKKFYITFGKIIEMLKNRISFVYLGGVSIILALIGLLVKIYK